MAFMYGCGVCIPLLFFMGVFYVLCVRTFYVLWRSLTCFMPSFMRVFYAVLCVFYLVCFFLIYLFKYILLLKKTK